MVVGCKNKTNIQLQKMCCFRDDAQEFDMSRDVYPNVKQICCWRILRARRIANQFCVSEEAIKAYELEQTAFAINITVTVCLVSMYIVALLPFFKMLETKSEHIDQEDENLPEPINYAINIVFLAFLMITLVIEICLVVAQRSRVNLKFLNLYIFSQLLTGLMQRGTILYSAQLIAIFSREE